MLKTKVTLAAASLATASALVIALAKTPKTPIEDMSSSEKKEFVAKLAEKEKARTFFWNNKKSIVSNVANAAKAAGNVIIQDAEKTTDHPVPLTAALALELLGLGAAIKSDNKKAQKKRLHEERIKRIEENSEEIENLRQAIYDKDLKIRALRKTICDIDRENSEISLEIAHLNDKIIWIEHNDIPREESNLAYIRKKGPDKSSNGYSPDGDHIYGSRPTESYAHFEWRIREQEQKIENLKQDVRNKKNKANSLEQKITSNNQEKESINEEIRELNKQWHEYDNKRNLLLKRYN